MSADDNHKPLIEDVDTQVPRGLQIPNMSEPVALLIELERIEAKIGEIRAQELEVDTRLAVVQQEKDELVDTRVTYQEMADLIRQKLGRPVEKRVLQLQAGRSPPQRSAPLVPRRQTRPGSKRDQCLAIMRPLFENAEQSASRQQIKQAWLAEGLLEGSENIESAASTMLNHFKNYGLITNDGKGTWTWIGLR